MQETQIKETSNNLHRLSRVFPKELHCSFSRRNERYKEDTLFIYDDKYYVVERQNGEYLVSKNNYSGEQVIAKDQNEILQIVKEWENAEN